MTLEPARTTESTPRVTFGRRWFSRRALLLHLAVVLIAPGCAVAGWWQATRALAGNGLSWVYSVEWPIFAILAVAGWWHLIHEDPEAYAARRAQSPAVPGSPVDDTRHSVEVPVAPAIGEDTDRGTLTFARATRLAVAAGLESVLGVVGIFAIPFDRPSGWVPTRGEAVYLAHAVIGMALAPGAAVLVAKVRGGPRPVRGLAWTGLVGVALAGAGGLLTAGRSLPRFAGVAFMFVGAATAILAYLALTLLAFKRRSRPEPLAHAGAEPPYP